MQRHAFYGDFFAQNITRRAFDIGNDDIANMVDGGNTLTITVDGTGITLSDINPFAESGATINTDVTSGSTRTVDWDNGIQLIVNG